MTSDEKNSTTQSSGQASGETPTALKKGVRKDFKFAAGGQSYEYSVEADWLPIYKEDKAIAEIFYTAYLRGGDTKAAPRPITFVFNGGPGAASVFLHIGALGPRRAAFHEDGNVPPPPARLVDNAETWLAFTDLVFLDPVGTGFSRLKKDEPGKDAKSEGAKVETKSDSDHEFFRMNRDLDSLSEAISRLLGKLQRWGSPVYIAGESYGGFRVAKLARRLQESFGVGLNGAILISPALEVSLLNGSDYDVGGWIDAFPSMAASAFFHRRAKGPADAAAFQSAAEDFATGDLVKLILRGEALASDERDRILGKIADFLGLDEQFVRLKQGRVPYTEFARRLFRDDRKVCGIYDASITSLDPFPDRESFQGPDPTLYSIDRVFSGGINQHLRQHLGVDTHRDYRVLSMDVFRNWKVDEKGHMFDSPIGATDDLRYGMALNPDMKVFICHGFYDLVTPYFSSQRIASLMRLDAKSRAQLTQKNYGGGHMFYLWQRSREEFTSDIAAFVEGPPAGTR